MRRMPSALLPALLLTSTLALAANWHTGKLMDSEKQEVPTGSTTTYNTDSQAKDGKYSQNTTANKVENTDTYQVFTIQTPTKPTSSAKNSTFPGPSPPTLPWAKRSSSPSRATK